MKNAYYEKRERKLQVVLSQNMRFPEHLHEDIELLLVRRGQIEVNVMGERRILCAGDCAVIFPEQIHSYHSREESTVQLLIFDASLSGVYRNVMQKYRPEDPFLSSQRLDSDVRLAFDRILAAWERHEANELEVARAWIQVILALIMPSLSLAERKKEEGADVTCRLVSYITEHYQEQLTLEVLARELHVNKFYLSHIFSDRLKVNFRQYLNQIRLEHALLEMKSTDHSITRIWEEAGFNSQRSFNRVFLEQMGMTPMEYRRALKGKYTPTDGGEELAVSGNMLPQ